MGKICKKLARVANETNSFKLRRSFTISTDEINIKFIFDYYIKFEVIPWINRITFEVKLIIITPQN